MRADGKTGENMENYFEYIKKTYYENLFDITNLEENIHVIFYSVLAFFLPFVLGHPQILVGIIVNTYLILGATYLKGYKLLPVILLPSIGVLTAGVLFGSYTVFLVYMIPFIWIGNAIFAYGHRLLHFRTKKYYLSMPVSAILKTAFLFGSAYALVGLHIIPATFLTTMGLFQLYTALIGGVAAYGIILARAKFAHSA